MLETADRLVSIENEPSLQQYQLLAGALHALVVGTSDGPRPATLIMDSYLLRALATAGLAPSLDACAACGAAGPHESFSPAVGGMVCRGCRPPGTAMPLPGTLDYLAHLISGQWSDTRSVPDHVQRQPPERRAGCVKLTFSSGSAGICRSRNGPSVTSWSST